MEDYNPRQITRMRWKDAKTLEHLIFKANDIEFDNGNVYKLSELSEAKQLVKHIKYCYDNQIPLIIYDYESDRVFIASNFLRATEVNLSCLNGSVNLSLNLSYDGQDSLSISLANETFLTDTNAPKMYRHQITLNYDGEYGTLSLIVYSSSNLNVNSLEALTTLLKPNNNTLYYVNTIGSLTIYTFELIYDNNVWKTGAISEDTGMPNDNITSVSDIVEPA